MSGIGDRHSGTAGGALRPGGKPVSVEIRLGPDAFRTSVQHTAWMLVNILCRLQGAVSIVLINCPSGIKVPGRLSPLITEGEELRDALISGARAIGSPEDGFVSVELLSRQPIDIVVGAGFEFCADATFCAVGNGLCGGIFSREIAPPARFSDLTIGPYIAACLAAGEIFRLVRLNSYVPERQLFLNAMDHSHGIDPTWTHLEIENELRSVMLVGVGAVGSASLHALFPLPLRGTILLADNDEKGIDTSNLGRYSLFGWASLGKPKATEAAQLLQQAEFRIVSHDGSFEYFFTGADKPRIVLSAVDKNTSRHALQEQYAPLYISASTHNLRMEVLRCGPPAVGACLACFNPLETEQRTEDDIRALLHDRPEIEANLCQKLKLDANEVAAWVRGRKCSETGDRLVNELRTDDGSAPAFAVGFVSVLSGTLLAAELLKTVGRHPGPLDDARNRAVFQFQNPAAVTNALHSYPRDGRCMACSPENLGTQIWRRRYGTFSESP